MLTKSFKAGKCKTALKLAMSRIKLLRNKREVQVRQMKRELAQLLETGQDQTARIRVEHVIREEKTMSAYDLIEIYCELIVARLPIIESQKSCPIDLKEAISSVVFASPRCADIPELMDIRKHFVAKYGKEFITSALEVRPDCGVNRMMVEKLSAKAPDIETKVKNLTAIAQEHNVKWDSKAFEEQLNKPHADLLNGPNTFASSSKMPMESPHDNLSFASNQKNESMTSFQNDVTNKPTSMNTSSHTNMSAPKTSSSSTPMYESRAPDRSGGEVKNPSSRKENVSFDRPVWNMEFKDATSAAQAAAESAEMASMAARAAAELATRGNFSRQVSSGSHGSSKYGTKENKPVNSKGTNLEGAHTVQGSVSVEEDVLKTSQGMNLDMQNLQRDEVVQVSSWRESGGVYGDHASFKSRPLSRSSSHSSGTSIDDDLPEVKFHEADTKAYGHAQSSFSEAEPVVHISKDKKTENVEFDRWDTNKRYNKSESSHFSGSAFDDDTKWDSNIQKHDNDNGKESTSDAGAGIFAGGQKQPSFNNYSAVVFDDYGSDTDDVSIFGRDKEEHLFNSVLPDQHEDSSSFPSAVDTSSPKQHRSGSIVKKSGSQLHFAAEPHSVEHSETRKNGFFPSQSNDNLPATFDDSDGNSSESEDEMSKPLVSSSGYEKNHEPGPNSADKTWKRSGLGGFPSDQPSSRNDKTSRRLINSERGAYYCQPNEEPQSWQSSKVSATEEAETKDKFGMPSSHSDTADNEISNEFSESGQVLNLGRLSGGMKNKGFQRPPYIKGPLIGTSVRSQQNSSDNSFSIDKPIVSQLDESPASLEFPDQGRYDEESRQEDYMSKSRILRASMGPDLESKELVSRRNTSRRGYSAEALQSSDKTAEVTRDLIQRPIISHQDEISEDIGIPSLESYNKRRHSKGYNEISSNSPVSVSNTDSIEQPGHNVGIRRSRDKASVQLEQSMDLPPAVEAPKVDLHDQRPRRKAYDVLRSGVPLTYFESDDESEELKQRQAVRHRANKDVKLSRRTRNIPSEAKRNSHHSDVLVNSGKENKQSQTSSAFELPDATTHATNLEGKEGSISLQQNSSIEAPPMTPTMSEPLAFRESLKSSNQDSTQSADPGKNGDPTASSASKGLISRESSLKNASHVHPKLPDYDALAAHFHSLRSNRR